MPSLAIGAVSFDMPDFPDLRNDDGTLVAYPPASDYANARVSVSTVAKDGKPMKHETTIVLQAVRNVYAHRSGKAAVADLVSR
jgi:hypothetical protein